MKKTNEEKIALLNETIAYYTENPLRRCLNDVYECFYFGGNNMKTQSDGCAIGRLLPKDFAEELDKEFIYNIRESGVKKIFDRLPIEVQAYGVGFLSELQFLHDCMEFWNERGLTDEGEERAELIMHNIINNEYKS